MKNVFMFSMTPEEFEFMLRKLLQEEMQKQQPPKKDESILPFKAEILDINKAAEFINLPVGTIRKKIKCKQHPIPHLKPGRALLFRKPELIRWQKEEEQLAKEKQAIKHELKNELEHYLARTRK